MGADRDSDIEYWGLTRREAVNYLGRVSAYYGRKEAFYAEQAIRYGEQAARYGRVASRLAVVQAALWGVVALVLVGKLAGWWA